MEQALLIISEYQGWIYAVLGLAAAAYLRLVIKWQQEYRRSVFGLERDQAATQLTRSLVMLGLVAVVAISTFLVAAFLEPSVPLSARPTPIPTISLLLTVPPLGTTALEEPLGAAELATPDPAGCLNPGATISSPLPGDEISGRVEIVGSADIPSFAFYKIEVRATLSGSAWKAITAGTSPVNDGLLGTWDTSLAEPGPHQLRLVVTDTVGNAPLPCGFEVIVRAADAG